jgi:RNA 3'-terminal phosphate cyclase (ATP)
VFFPLLHTMGVHVKGRLVKRGYYPKGRGKAEVLITPCRDLRPPCFDSAPPAIEGRVNIANLPWDIAERVKHAAEEEFTREGMQSSIVICEEKAASPGVGIVLWTRNGKILGGDYLGERGVRAEAVGVRAAQHLLRDLKAGADVDEHAVDHILPYMALVPRPSSLTCREISAHADTEMWLLKHFLDVHFEIKKREGKKEIHVFRRSHTKK